MVDTVRTRLLPLALCIAAVTIIACGGFLLPLGPSQHDEAALRRDVSGSGLVLIAALAPGGSLDTFGMVMHVDRQPIIRGVAMADQPFPKDIIGGPIWKDFQNTDIRPAKKGYVVFAANPAQPSSALFGYAAFGHVAGDKRWLLGNFNLSFFSNAQVPWPLDDALHGRVRDGAYAALVADVQSPGVYYLGDYQFEMGIGKDERTSSQLLDDVYVAVGGMLTTEYRYSRSITRNFEEAKQFAAKLGIDAAKMQDLSGGWKLLPKATIEQTYFRKAGQPLPATFTEFMKKGGGGQ